MSSSLGGGEVKSPARNKTKFSLTINRGTNPSTLVTTKKMHVNQRAVIVSAKTKKVRFSFPPNLFLSIILRLS